VATASTFNEVVAILPFNLILNCCHGFDVFITINTFFPSGVRKATLAKSEMCELKILVEPGLTNFEAWAII